MEKQKPSDVGRETSSLKSRRRNFRRSVLVTHEPTPVPACARWIAALSWRLLLLIPIPVSLFYRDGQLICFVASAAVTALTGYFLFRYFRCRAGGHAPGRICHRHVWLAGVRPLRRAAVHLLRKPGASGGCVLRIDVWLHHGRRLSNHRYRGEPQKRALLAAPSLNGWEAWASSS